MSPNGIKQGDDYENVAVCTKDPTWSLDRWDDLTPDVLPSTHLAQADRLLVARGAESALDLDVWTPEGDSYGPVRVYRRDTDWAPGTPPSGAAVMTAVTANAGIHPNVIYCAQGLRTSRERSDVPFRVAPRYQGLWAVEAEPVDASEMRLSLAAPSNNGARRVEIGIVDTGIAQGQYLNPALEPAVMPRWLVSGESGDNPDLDGNGEIESPAGHGTFVGGVIAKIEPQVRLHVIRAVGRQGAVSDGTLTERIDTLLAALAEAGIELDILNLSLGAWTYDDYQPLLLGDRLSRLPGRTLVVSAAGNLESRRKFWPAAMERVVSVGSVVKDGDFWARAEYSNYGDWVSAVAHDGAERIPGSLSEGGQISTYFTGFPPGTPNPEYTGWARWRGTSFTAPKVAGRIAQVMIRDDLRTAEEAWQRLREESRESGQNGPPPDFPNAVFVADADPATAASSNGKQRGRSTPRRAHSAQAS